MTRDEMIEVMARAFTEKNITQNALSYFSRSEDYTVDAVSDLVNRYYGHCKPSVKAALSALEAAGYVVVPKEPSDGLLMSMALRYDHGLGCPGYYDEVIFDAEPGGHARRLKSTISDMRKLHEEVVGSGFHSSERDGEYVAMLSASQQEKTDG